MITIAGHTFDESLLGDGVIIDVGCRGFEFSDYFIDKLVYCIDPDKNVFHDRPTSKIKMTFGDNGGTCIHNHLNVAISDKSGETTYYENGEATMIREIDPDPTYPHINEKYKNKCKTITMDELYEITGENVDLLKLDCEGAEYIILGETFKPIPKQISVEFHYHCVPDLHMANFNNILNRLLKDYTVHNMNWEARHGCGFNYWDVLFIKREQVCKCCNGDGWIVSAGGTRKAKCPKCQ